MSTSTATGFAISALVLITAALTIFKLFAEQKEKSAASEKSAQKHSEVLARIERESSRIDLDTIRVVVEMDSPFPIANVLQDGWAADVCIGETERSAVYRFDDHASMTNRKVESDANSLLVRAKKHHSNSRRIPTFSQLGPDPRYRQTHIFEGFIARESSTLIYYSDLNSLPVSLDIFGDYNAPSQVEFREQSSDLNYTYNTGTDPNAAYPATSSHGGKPTYYAHRATTENEMSTFRLMGVPGPHVYGAELGDVSQTQQMNDSTGSPDVLRLGISENDLPSSTLAGTFHIAPISVRVQVSIGRHALDPQSGAICWGSSDIMYPISSFFVLSKPTSISENEFGPQVDATTDE